MSRTNLFAAGLILSFFLLQRTSAQETLLEQARQSAGDPVMTVRSVDVPVTGIEELAKGSDVVLRATITNPRSYFTPDGRDVMTDYILANPELVGGIFPVLLSPMPGRPIPIVMVLYGGEVTVNGARVIAETTILPEYPKHGEEYLLFLKKLGHEPGRYEPYNYGMFKIEQGHASAVIKQAKEIFKGTNEAPLADLVSRISRSAK